jgi:hypothetical protein
MRRSPRATAQRTLRRALTWQPKVAGRSVLPIRSLVSPFRYDVVVRAQLFALVDENPHVSTDELVDLARSHPYAVWFEHVAMPRFRPWVLQDATVYRDAFVERVTSARALAHSVAVSGFDVRHPVVLRSTRGTTTTDAGTPVARTLHVGDGGHRLALLLQATGTLGPGQYRTDPRRRQVIDNTLVLLRHLPLGLPAYLDFLAPGYTAGEVRDADGLVELVQLERPELLPELDGVLALHLPLVGAR